MFQNQSILITGATGSWGYELVKQLLLHSPKEIRIFSRNEYNQVKMKRFFEDSKLHFTVGDIRDYSATLLACKDIDYIFHLAALKHVTICEEQPLEAIKTNITGTENIIQASIIQGVKKVINVSSDKSVDPTNLYGLTKGVGEKLILQANQLTNTTRFVCIRAGNVLGTNGSIVPFFKKLIQNGENIPITSIQMTRFFLTLPEAIKLLLTASLNSIGGETFVMKMKACKIIDLAEVMVESFSQTSINFRDIGIRPGEKLHELLISINETPQTYEFKDDYYVKLPTAPSNELLNRYGNLPKVSFTKYESSSDLMNKKEIHEMLAQGGFLS